MRKIFLCTAFFLLLNLPAMAGVQRFGPLSVEVPEGWTALKQGAATIIKSQRSKASVTVAVNSMGEASLGDIAERLCDQMNGHDYEKDVDGDYSFFFTNHAGAECFALLTDSGDGRYIIMSASGLGEGDEVTRQIEAIIDSLDWNE